MDDANKYQTPLKLTSSKYNSRQYAYIHNASLTNIDLCYDHIFCFTNYVYLK